LILLLLLLASYAPSTFSDGFQVFDAILCFSFSFSQPYNSHLKCISCYFHTHTHTLHIAKRVLSPLVNLVEDHERFPLV
jgi:hypothetical protein